MKRREGYVTEALLEVRDLSVTFSLPQQGSIFSFKKEKLKAVDQVSFEMVEGEVLGVVGESGSGKSTLARAIIGLNRPSSGEIRLDRHIINQLRRKELRRARRDMRMIFQDPLASLDPRMTVGNIVAEPLQVYAPELTHREKLKLVAAMLERVGLSAVMMNRYPHEFSGGQCQRIGIARALVVQPKLLICDEPTTALDMTIQAQIIQLLREINREYRMAILLVTHDFRTVAGLCDRVLVMKQGRKVEEAFTQLLFEHPKADYTKQLLAAIPHLPDRSSFLDTKHGFAL